MSEFDNSKSVRQLRLMVGADTDQFLAGQREALRETISQMGHNAILSWFDIAREIFDEDLVKFQGNNMGTLQDWCRLWARGVGLSVFRETFMSIMVEDYFEQDGYLYRKDGTNPGVDE